MTSTRAAHTPLRPTSVAVPGRAGLRLTTRGYILALLVLVLLLAAFAVGRSASSQAMERPSTPAPVLAQVTVQPGDTLWQIARRVAPEKDPRDVVSQIRRLNHLPTAAVQAGRQLLLPAPV